MKGAEQAGIEARCNHWLALGRVALASATALRSSSDEGAARFVAFLLHQACEYLLAAIITANTAISGKLAPERKAELRADNGGASITGSHSLPYMRALALDRCGALGAVLPLSNDEERRRFTRLKKAYTRSRYCIGPLPLAAEDVDALFVVLGGLQRLAEQHCIEARSPGVQEAA